MKLFFFLISVLLMTAGIPFSAIPQVVENELTDQWFLPSSEDESPDLSLWADLNDWFQDHPIPLNTATRQQLLELPGMDGLMADAILSYQENPGFLHISQLYEIPEIPSSYLLYLEKWVQIESNEKKQDENQVFVSETRHRTRVNRISDEKVRIKKLSLYNRIKIKTPSGWNAGLIAEKDKDEAELTDYVNGTLFFQSPNPTDWVSINKFAAGSYQLAFGEGLLFSRSASMGKSSAVISSPIKNSGGLLPYLSTDENRFLSGLSGSVLFPDAGIETGLFYSSARYDGERKKVIYQKNQNQTGEAEEFRFDNSGLHTTPSALAKKDNLPVKFWGGWMTWSGNETFSFSGAAGIQKFEKLEQNRIPEINSELPPARDERFKNYSEKVRFVSFSGGITTKKIVFSGEFSRFGDYSAFAGWILAEPFRGFKYILHHRNAEPGFSPLFGRPFADKMSSPGNETGWYQGLELTVLNTVLSFYRDEFKHPWPGYQNLFPAQGKEWFAGVEKRWTGTHTLKLQVRYLDESQENGFSRVHATSRKIKGEWTFPLSEEIRLKTRVDLNQSVKSVSGRALSNQINMSFKDFSSLVFQCSWFDANRYEDRIYIYESDLPGMMIFNPLNGEGVRLSLVTGIKVFSWMKFSMKLSFEKSQRVSAGELIPKNEGFGGFQLDFNN